MIGQSVWKGILQGASVQVHCVLDPTQKTDVSQTPKQRMTLDLTQPSHDTYDEGA